jgi:hypothetical protein
MNASEKYNKYRNIIKNGDIILFRGNRLLARLIQYFDSAYYNHVGIAMECNGRLFIIDSNACGVEPEFLSTRMKKYTDFGILRINQSQNEINNDLTQVLIRAEDHIKYDFLLALRVAVARKIGYDFKNLGNSNKDICSEWVRRFTNQAQVKCYITDILITPQDFKRLQDPSEIITIL